MQAYHNIVKYGMLALCIVLAALPAGATETGEIPRLISQLGADNPVLRQAAQERIVAIGPAARPALRSAMRGGDGLETQSRAAQALVCIPQGLAGDPPAVRLLLQSYCSPYAGPRAAAALRLGKLPDFAAFGALLRLFADEPNVDVRWAIVQAMLAQAGDSPDPAHVRELRKLEEFSDSAPALAAAAWAWAGDDPPRTASLLRRAVQLEAQTPSNTTDLGWVFTRAYENAILRGAWDEAADILRQATWRGQENFRSFVPAALAAGPEQTQEAPEPDDDVGDAQDESSVSGVPMAVASLFVLHAQVGPLRGFKRDLQVYHEFLSQPAILYCLARMYERNGERLLAEAFEFTALRASGIDGLSHEQVAYFLLDHGWPRQAKAEFAAAVNAPRLEGRINAFAIAGLAQIAATAGEHAAAAQLYQQVGDALSRAVAPTDDETNQTRAYFTQAQAHESLRVACRTGDRPGMQKQIEYYAANAPKKSDPDIAIDLVAALRQLHRDADAQAAFEAAYDQLKKNCAGYPPDPTALNSLAWLCANCGQHLDEALAAATTATQISTGNGAILDTAALANFRLGRRDEALRLETLAHQLQPEDPVIAAQLRLYATGHN